MMIVTCEEKLTDIALYAGGDLEEEKVKALEEHLEECPECLREYEALKGAVRLSAQFDPETPSLSKIMDSVRKEHTKMKGKWFLGFSIASAAAIFLFTVFSLFHYLRGSKIAEKIKVPALANSAVEVLSVGYNEAQVRILPTENKSMTVVWIVSEEVVSKRE